MYYDVFVRNNPFSGGGEGKLTDQKSRRKVCIIEHPSSLRKNIHVCLAYARQISFKLDLFENRETCDKNILSLIFTLLICI